MKEFWSFEEFGRNSKFWRMTYKKVKITFFGNFFFKNGLNRLKKSSCIIFWLKLTTFCNFWQKMTVCVQKITNFGKKWPFFLTKHTQNMCKNKPTSSKIYQYLTVAFLLSQLVSVCSQNKHCVLLLLLVLKWPSKWDLTQKLKKTSNKTKK